MQGTRETQRLLEMAKETNENSGTPEGPKSSDDCICWCCRLSLSLCTHIICDHVIVRATRSRPERQLGNFRQDGETSVRSGLFSLRIG